MPKSQIIKDLVENRVPLSQSLDRLYVLAYDLKNERLAEWALNEAKGYKDDLSTPDYRKTKCVDFVYSGINGPVQVQNAAFPTGWLPDGILEKISTVCIRDGIETIEKFSKSENAPYIDYSDFAGHVANVTDESVFCTSIHQKLSQPFFASICYEVRSRVLQVLLELEKTYGVLDNLGIDVTSQTQKQLLESNNDLNRMILNFNLPEKDTPKEKVGSKIAWNIIIPVITGIVVAVLGALVLSYLGL